jgi:plastocyanin
MARLSLVALVVCLLLAIACEAGGATSEDPLVVTPAPGPTGALPQSTPPPASVEAVVPPVETPADAPLPETEAVASSPPIGASASSAITPVPSPTSAPAAPSGVQSITVRAADYTFAPREFSLRPGRVRLTFVNDGGERHTFNVKNLDYRGELFNSGTFEPGETAVMEFSISGPGVYTFFCIMYGHQNKGQDGVLIVQP